MNRLSQDKALSWLEARALELMVNVLVFCDPITGVLLQSTAFS